MAQSHQERSQQLMQQELARRSFLANVKMEMSNDPRFLPEAQDAMRSEAVEIGMSDLMKPLRKGLEGFESAAKVHVNAGSPGWLGGQTQRQLQTQPMPMATQQPGAAPLPVQTGPLPPSALGPGTGLMAAAPPPVAPPGMAGMSQGPPETMTPPPST